MLEKQIMDLRNPLVDGRAYYDAAPANTPQPYLTIQQVGGDPIEFLDGPSGSDSVRVQINTFADERTAANALMTAVRGALQPLKATPVGAPFSTYEETVRIYGRSCDFSMLAAV